MFFELPKKQEGVALAKHCTAGLAAKDIGHSYRQRPIALLSFASYLAFGLGCSKEKVHWDESG